MRPQRVGGRASGNGRDRDATRRQPGPDKTTDRTGTVYADFHGWPVLPGRLSVRPPLPARHGDCSTRRLPPAHARWADGASRTVARSLAGPGVQAARQCGRFRAAPRTATSPGRKKTHSAPTGQGGPPSRRLLVAAPATGTLHWPAAGARTRMPTSRPPWLRRPATPLRVLPPRAQRRSSLISRNGDLASIFPACGRSDCRDCSDATVHDPVDR